MMINPDLYKRALFLLGESYATLEHIYANQKINLPDELREYINNQLNEVAQFTSLVSEESDE